MKLILSAVTAVLVGALTVTSCSDHKTVAADYVARNDAHTATDLKPSASGDASTAKAKDKDPPAAPETNGGAEPVTPPTPKAKEAAKEPAKPAETKAPAAGINFATVNSKIFSQCVGCHNASLTLGGVNLEDYAKVKAVAAKIKAVAIGPKASMPTSGPLPEADQKLLGDWIAAGTPEK